MHVIKKKGKGESVYNKVFNKGNRKTGTKSTVFCEGEVSQAVNGTLM